jgi:hypothetical protein
MLVQVHAHMGSLRAPFEKLLATAVKGLSQAGAC